MHWDGGSRILELISGAEGETVEIMVETVDGGSTRKRVKIGMETNDW
jgi:hypothetical protein